MLTKTNKQRSLPNRDLAAALTWLHQHCTRKTLEGMARYGIPSDNAFGVSVADIRRLAKKLGRSHGLAAALWTHGCYEARMLACFVDEPALVTAQQMDGWAKQFDSWAICDTACFHLFDRTPFAWKKAHQWAKSPKEFVKRAGFALMASFVAHDKKADDIAFLDLFPLIELGAKDERNFVKKSVSWALRAIGKRSLALNAAAIEVGKRLAGSKELSSRWVGKDALRELTNPKLRSRLTAR